MLPRRPKRADEPRIGFRRMRLDGDQAVAIRVQKIEESAFQAVISSKVVTGATLVVTGALLVVTRSY